MARITSFTAEELEALVLLIPRIFADYRAPDRGPFEMLYCMAETRDNEGIAFVRAVQLARVGAMRRLGICGGGTEAGYAGFDHSVERLRALGYDEVKVPIERLPFEGDPNTLAEAQVLASLGIAGDIGVLAPPLHIIRAFATVATVFARKGLPARIFSVPGVPAPWNIVVSHSQGASGLTRADWLVAEIQRFEKYQAAEYGGMLSAQNILSYLSWRDTTN